MLVQITVSPAFRFHCGTSQGKFGTNNTIYRMAAPVTSSGWPGPAQGLSVVQAGPTFVTQPAGSSMHQQQHFPQPMQTHQQTAEYHDVSTTDSDSGSDCGAFRVPLKLVVQDAVKRWFNETLSEARRGDIKQQALLAQMYAEGYGCKQDLKESRVWAERARCRGYQMSGVYCEL